jgi:glycosyltransferase involved in cell wall biosynthesis
LGNVSVIIPTIRLDAWLDQAVFSVLSSRGVEVEVIVVHDGIAPDPTRPWMLDSRVRVVHLKSRLGQSEGMRRGILRASSALIARLDGDDYCSPDRLALQMTYLAEHPETVAVGSRVMSVDSSGHNRGELRFAVGNDIRGHLLLQNVVAHSSLLFRAEAGQRVHGYDSTLSQMEDYDFILRLSSLGPIANLDRVLTFYRVHAHQVSRGAAPWGPHMRKIASGRRALRRVLREPFFPSEAKHLLWKIVQLLRYCGIRKLGYESTT